MRKRKMEAREKNNRRDVANSDLEDWLSFRT